MGDDATMAAIDRIKVVVSNERRDAHRLFGRLQQKSNLLEQELKKKNDEISTLTAQNETKKRILAIFGQDVTEEQVKRIKESADAYEAAGGAAAVMSLRAAAPRSTNRTAESAAAAAYKTMLTGLGMNPGDLFCMEWSGPMHSLVEVMDFPALGFEEDVNVRVVVNLGRNTFFNISKEVASSAMTLLTVDNVYSVRDAIFKERNLDALWAVDNDTLSNARFKSSVNLTFHQYCNKVRKDTIDAISGHVDFASIDLLNGSRSTKAAVTTGSLKETTKKTCPARAARGATAKGEASSSSVPLEDVFVTHERSLEQRNEEGFSNAIVLD